MEEEDKLSKEIKFFARSMFDCTSTLSKFADHMNEWRWRSPLKISCEECKSILQSVSENWTEKKRDDYFQVCQILDTNCNKVYQKLRQNLAWWKKSDDYIRSLLTTFGVSNIFGASGVVAKIGLSLKPNTVSKFNYKLSLS